MAYSRYVKPEIICERCGKQARPVREKYCKSCASVLVKNGIIPKIIGIETPLDLTQYQNQILTGLMLGDGCIYKHKKTSVIITIDECLPRNHLRHPEIFHT